MPRLSQEAVASIANKLAAIRARAHSWDGCEGAEGAKQRLQALRRAALGQPTPSYCSATLSALHDGQSTPEQLLALTSVFPLKNNQLLGRLRAEGLVRESYHQLVMLSSLASNVEFRWIVSMSTVATMTTTNSMRICQRRNST